MTSRRPNIQQIVAVATVLGVGAFAMGVLRPMLPIYLASLRVEPSMLGLIVPVSMLGMVVGESLSGIVADRFGLRVPFFIGTVVCGVVSMGFVVSSAVPYLFGVAFVWGVLRASVLGSGRGFLASAAPPDRKATYLAIGSAIASLSRGAGALPGGFIADTWATTGSSTWQGGWRCWADWLSCESARVLPVRLRRSLRPRPAPPYAGVASCRPSRCSVSPPSSSSAP